MRAELEAWRLGIPQPRLTVLLHGLDRLPAVDRVMRLGLREAAALAVNRKAERIQAVWRGYSARKELLPRSANSLLPGRSWPLSRSFLDSVLAHPDSDVLTEAVKVLDTGLYHAVWQFTALGDGAFDVSREDPGRSPVRLRVVNRPDWHVHADAVSVEEAAQLEYVLRPLVCDRWSAKRSNAISGPPCYLETRDGRCFWRRIQLRTQRGNRVRKGRSARERRRSGERCAEVGQQSSLDVAVEFSVAAAPLSLADPLKPECYSIATPRGGAPEPVDRPAMSGPARRSIVTCDVTCIRAPGWRLCRQAVW